MSVATLPAVRLDRETHTYYLGRRVIPGVTTILEQIDELEHIPKEWLERAAAFGTHVHLACDYFNHDALNWDTLDPALEPYVRGWVKFLATTNARVIDSERLIDHPTYGYAGTLDSIVEWSVSPRPVLIDLKSGDRVLRSARPQTSAYKAAYEAETGIKLARARYVCHLTGDGEFKLHRYADESDFQIFLSCLNCYRWVNNS